jgi:hypothetical protein
MLSENHLIFPPSAGGSADFSPDVGAGTSSAPTAHEEAAPAAAGAVDLVEVSFLARSLLQEAEAAKGAKAGQGQAGERSQVVQGGALVPGKPDVEESKGAGAAEEEEESSALSSQELNEEEQEEVERLKGRDREVRAHEHAHLAAAGSYARGGSSSNMIRGLTGAAMRSVARSTLILRKYRTIQRPPSRRLRSSGGRHWPRPNPPPKTDELPPRRRAWRAGRDRKFLSSAWKR